MAHTPGPWHAIKPPKLGKHWRVGATKQVGTLCASFLVAMIDNGAPGDTLETEEDNARLVAAAPELLAFAKEWQSKIAYLNIEAPWVGQFLTDVASLIAKAEGN